MHSQNVLDTEDLRRRGGGVRFVEYGSVLTEGDLNSQNAKRALPSYSRIDFADMFATCVDF